MSLPLPIQLDGAAGGQVLRTALTLALVTGAPFRLHRFRADRPSPGLRPRHLALLRAAEALGGTAEGATLGGLEVDFHPTPVHSGEYVLELGPTGSAPLVFQMLAFPLALAGGGTVRLRGLTHAPQGTSYHHLAWAWLPLVAAYGLRATLSLLQAGFSPDGVGEFRATLEAMGPPPLRVEVPARGTLHDVAVRALVGGLPFEVAGRATRAAVTALRERGIYCSAENLPLPVGRTAGSVVFIRAQFENTFAAFTVVGERGDAPEEVGARAAAALSAFMESAGALDERLADQILLPAALLAAGTLGPVEPGSTRFTTARVTPHLEATRAVVERFLPVEVSLEPGGRLEVRRLPQGQK
ncbi:MAG: RNA 3'-terminal phosphate cyclase [Myxococcaceae bacterium]